MIKFLQLDTTKLKKKCCQIKSVSNRIDCACDNFIFVAHVNLSLIKVFIGNLMVKKRLFSLKDNILKMLCNEINLVLLLKIRFLFLTQKNL